MGVAADGEDLFYLRRKKEFFRVVRERIGSGVDLPDCDDSLSILEVYADTLRLQHEVPAAELFLRRFAAKRAPWLGEADVARIMLGAADFQRLSQRQVGLSLCLRADERDAWHISTIAAVDLSPEDAKIRAKALKRDRDRARAAARRQAAGAISRDDYRANSISAAKPWQTEKISRRTWERRRAIETVDVASASLANNRGMGGDGLATGRVSPWIEAGVSRATYYRQRKLSSAQGGPGSPDPLPLSQGAGS